MESKPSAHTLRVEVLGAADWNDVEAQAAPIIARYFDVPRRGRGAESRDLLLGGSDVQVTVRADGTFDAVVKVTRA